MSVFWAAWNKQCMLAAGKHQKLISWRKETTWRPKTLMLGFYETHFGASWRRSDMLLTMAFDSLVNSSPFSQGNTVCTYQFFLSAPYHYWIYIPLRKLSNFLPHNPYHTLVMFYKIHTKQAPLYLTSLLPPLPSRSGYTFRKLSYRFPTVSRSSTLNSFLPRAVALWNALPTNVQQGSSIYTFKKLLQSHLKT